MGEKPNKTKQNKTKISLHLAARASATPPEARGSKSKALKPVFRLQDGFRLQAQATSFTSTQSHYQLVFGTENNF
jgi:hypothetical protein